jgi:hypothetical protein
MTESEQLHYAALAGGYDLFWVNGMPHVRNSVHISSPWDCRYNEGDAHRLAVNLGLGIKHMPGARRTFVSLFPYVASLPWDSYPDERYGATLAGITEVAAMMGRARCLGRVA